MKRVTEADGTVLVSDQDEIVTGVGATLDEAQQDFVHSLHQHVRYLRENRHRLHPRMIRQLEYLEQAFPWV